MTNYRASGLLAAFLGFLAGQSASAQDETSRFYAGRNLTFIVGSTTGGGYDFNARAVARHMGKYIPGAPNIVVQNMPGAGSIVATNYVYNVAPQDGSVIGVVQRPIPFEPFFDEKGVRFDVRKINWLGSTTSEIGVVVAWHTAPQRSFKDVLEREMIVGGNGPAIRSICHSDGPLSKRRAISPSLSPAFSLFEHRFPKLSPHARRRGSHLVPPHPCRVQVRMFALLVRDAE